MGTSLMKDRLLVTLSKSKFELATKIIKRILTATMKKQYPKAQKGEKVLELIVRLSKMRSGQSVIMSTEFKNSVFWKDIDLWVKIFGLLKAREERASEAQGRHSAKAKGLKGFFNSIVAKATNSAADQIKKKIQEVG